MPKSADDRIKRFLEKKASGDKQAKEGLARREAEMAQVKAKGEEALESIRELVRELNSDLSAASAHLEYEENAGIQPGFLATGTIVGTLASKPVNSAIRIRPNGDIAAYRYQASSQTEVTKKRHLSVLTATREQYKELILDVLGIG
jgi:hypothetical protein